MAGDLVLLVLSVLLHVATGGRVSLAVLAVTIYWAAHYGKRTTPSAPTQTRTLSRHTPPPIYAVEFTTTAVATATPVRRAGRAPRLVRTVRPKKLRQLTNAVNLSECPVLIFYTTLTGTTERVARQLCQQLLAGAGPGPQLLSLDNDVDDLEEFFLNTPKANALYVLVLPSYETDSPIDYFLEHLQETYNDFRVDKYPLRKLAGFAVLGLGDLELWPAKFCEQAKLADRWLGKLGARRVCPVGEVCVKHDGEEAAHRWSETLARLLADPEPFYLDEAEDLEEEQEVVDMEDLGQGLALGDSEQKKMVAYDLPTYKQLTKQGYTIVGSHLGVKICRWTKSALRGRGLCYKYAFYGIRLHLCMETTPSLACLNKCVFCWRHGTNPVAKANWRWELDPPGKVFEGALAGHYAKIKQMRGVPGVQMDRFAEAFRVRHCALSLVGEPIFYPHINELVGMLHREHISSFLVCNAQHPENLAALGRVTQLYVSIDAPTKVLLKKVDRPLNGDFWERLMACLDILRTTQSHQRTVFRLTLVKGFNMDDVASYADMVVRAQPLQIEVKGATFCGSSNANGNPLTMQNIPFYEECKLFVAGLVHELQSRGHDYELAAEHAHLCCILIAHKRFMIGGRWHTHIDYPRFFKLLESGECFIDVDYVSETPEWAVWGAPEGGFSPEDTRFDRQAEKAKRREQRRGELE